MRRESLFTQGKESGTRLIITFYQLCSECENIIFDVMLCAGRQITYENVTRKWKSPLRKQENGSQKKQVNF